MRSSSLCLLLTSLALLGLGTASCGGVDDSRLGPPAPSMDAGGAEHDAGGGLDAAEADAGGDAGNVVVCGGATCAPSQRCCGSVACGRCIERGTACPVIDCGPDSGTLPPGDAGPAPRTDAGPAPRTDAGPPPTGCGGMSCLPGFTCCGTAACGTCIPLGSGCMPPSCADGGMPPPRCGGLFDPPCAAGTFCDTPGCGSLGSTGTCQRRPSDCTGTTPMLVCGCDRNTFDNPCQAHRASVSVAHTGACDCREGGCPFGQRCIECAPLWVCRSGGC